MSHPSNPPQFIHMIVSGEDYKLRSYTQCNFFYLLVITFYPPYVQNILLFTNILNLCSSLNVRVEKHKTTILQTLPQVSFKDILITLITFIGIINSMRKLHNASLLSEK
jgi:hypothetical protein